MDSFFYLNPQSNTKYSKNTQKTYSSSQIAKALRENINSMWLSRNNKPDFRTLNRFQSLTIKGIIDENIQQCPNNTQEILGKLPPPMSNSIYIT